MDDGKPLPFVTLTPCFIMFWPILLAHDPVRLRFLCCHQLHSGWFVVSSVLTLCVGNLVGFLGDGMCREYI